MRKLGRRLGADQGGAAIVEFAIVLPILTLFIYGIFSVGRLYEANSGIQHALGEGARYATLCLNPSSSTCATPTSTQIKSKISSRLFGTEYGTAPTTTIDTSTASSGYVTIQVQYTETPDFLFFQGPAITLKRSKLVYLADTPGTKADCASGKSTAASCSIYS